MRRTIWIVCLLAGCAGPQAVYYHPEKPEAAFRQDEAQCYYEIDLANKGQADWVLRRRLFDQCIRARGYSRVK